MDNYVHTMGKIHVFLMQHRLGQGFFFYKNCEYFDLKTEQSEEKVRTSINLHQNYWSFPSGHVARHVDFHI